MIKVMAKLHYRESVSEEDKKAFAKYLAEDEELILAAGLSTNYLRSCFIVAVAWPGIVFMALGLGIAYWLHIEAGWGFVAGLMAAGLSAFFKTLHLHHAHRYLLTTRRVIIKKGIFTVLVTSALYDKITHIEVEQSFFNKIFMHQGTIIVNTAGMNKGEIALNYVGYPIEFKNLLERLINREREGFGRRGGPVVTVEGELV